MAANNTHFMGPSAMVRISAGLLMTNRVTAAVPATPSAM